MFRILLLMLMLTKALGIAVERDNTDSHIFLLDASIRTSFTSVSNSKVAKIYKRMGDSFVKGEILIQLDDTIQKCLYQKALAVLEKAEINYETKKILFQGRVASKDELINLKTELCIAESDVCVAKKNLDDTAVIAQYDGRVSYLNVEEGEYPNHEFYYKDKPMIETINEETLLAKILIPATLLPQIRHGQPVELKISTTGTTVTGHVKRIGAFIDPASGTVLIEAEVNNFERKLLAGMTGVAILGTHEKAL